MKQDKSQWHIWFAWHPVYINDEDFRQIVWWEDVMRRKVLDLDLCDGSYCWQYQTIDQTMMHD